MDEHSRKTIAKYLEDMHSLVNHGHQAFSRQLDEPQMRDHPEAERAVREFRDTLQRHRSMTESRLKALGTSPTTAVQDAVSAVAGVVAGLYNQVRTEAASRSLRDDYTFLSHCGISWLMLAVTARSLGDHDTEELAEQGYRDCARMAMEIDRVMPRLVVRELQQDQLPAQDVADWAERFVHSAWTGQPGGMAGGMMGGSSAVVGGSGGIVD